MSITAARKERERAAREELIIDHAQRLLLRDGYQNLNLDELAKAIEYSKGTIYLHFETKEDLALAVATRALRERADLFERATKFQGRTRERARAIGFACCQFAFVHRDFFNIEMMLQSTSFWEKASDERKRLHKVQASRTFHALNGIVIEAFRVGDLPSVRFKPEDVSFGLLAVTIGSHIAGVEPDLQMLCAVEDPLAAGRKNQDVLCDGFGWKPLTTEWDYAATDRRIRDSIFPDAKWLKIA